MVQKAAKSPSKSGGDELVFVALGGLGEIGMNVYLYGFGPANARQWLMVDLGITFPGELEPGVDVVLPDLKFIEEDPQSLLGIIVTHAHEDHIGAILDLWPRLKAPIYATPFTAGMINSKTAEFGGKQKIPLKQMALGARFSVGPFEVEFVTMSHSVPEPSALCIRTPLGTILHTGDWKLDSAPFVGDPANETRLQEIGREGVLAMVVDSTNAFREGRSPSETEVARSITEIVKTAKRRVAVTTFASNVARVKAVADAAEATGRELVVAGRSLHRVIGVAIDTGYLPKNFHYLDQDRAQYLNARDICLLCTGSQGEPRAAMARIAENEHPAIGLDKGDMVIFSSRTIPGNERPVGRIQNNLARMGVDVVTDNEALVHVTGHPRREELRQMYDWIKPQIAVPMHGEARHLKEQGRIARACGVEQVVEPLNGDLVLLAPGKPSIIDRVPVGRLFRDGRLIVSDDDGPVRERRKLMMVGLVMVAITLDTRGNVLGYPQVALDGVPQDTANGDAMYDVALDAVEGTLKSLPPARRRDPELVREAVRRAVRGAIADAWGKKPIAKVLMTVVEGKPN
jgi:ribonuclease J